MVLAAPLGRILALQPEIDDENSTGFHNEGPGFLPRDRLGAIGDWLQEKLHTHGGFGHSNGYRRYRAA
jgi:hypothetical protein